MKLKYLVLIILFGVGLWIFRDFNLDSTRSPIVRLTKSGFSPAGLKIKMGTKVRFMTSLNNNFWPASDLHPNHEIYPEFDPKRSLSPNESWEFEFDTIGLFRYHDHINPVNRGTIVVIDESVSTSRQPINTEDLLVECGKKENLNEKRDCFTNFLGDILTQKGPDYTFDIVNRLRNEDSGFASECHTTAHDLGAVAYWKYAKDKKLPKTGSVAYCGFGYIHGFMSEFGHHSRSFLTEADGVCDYFSNKLNYDGFEQMVDPFDQCYHGVGHGIAYFYVPDFWDNQSEIIQRGAKDCREMADDEWGASNCIFGLFGGLASVYVGGHGFTLPLDIKDPLKICRAEPDDLKGPCYDSMVPTLGILFEGDLGKLSSFFTGLKQEFLEQTFYSVGDLASRWFSQGKITSMNVLDECGKFVGVKKTSCFSGFVQGVIRNGFPKDAPILALNFCRSSIFSENEKRKCISDFLSEMKLIYPDKIGDIKKELLGDEL